MDKQKNAVNLLSGDNSFETGVQNWYYAQSEDTPSVTDEDAAEGKYSLVTDGIPLYSRWYYRLIKANQSYVFSFYAKSESHVNVKVTARDGWAVLGELKFTSSYEWKRYTLHINPQSCDRNIWFSAEPSGAGRILFDCFQLEDGECASDFHPESASIHSSITSPGEVYTPDDGKLALQLSFYIKEIISEEYRAGISVKCYPDNNPIYNNTLCVIPSSTGHANHSVLIPQAENPGYYTAHITLTDKNGNELACDETSFVSTTPFSDELDRDFFGFHSSRVNVEAQRRIGVGWVRYAAPAWKFVEPEKDTFRDFSSPCWHKMGIKRLTGIVGISSPPEWVSKNGTLPCKGEEIKHFAQFVIDRVGEDTDCYEMENEPDLTMVSSHNTDIKTGAASFSEMCHAIGNIVHKNGGKLLFNTSSASNNAMKFADKVFRSAADAIDIFGPHLYAWPRYIGPLKNDVSTPEDADLTGQIKTSCALAEKYTGNSEIWIGEYGYALDYEAGYDSFYAGLHAACVIRSYLLAKTVPEMKRIFYFTDYYTVEDRYDYGMWRGDMKPLPLAAAHAVCARMIGGSTASFIIDGPDYYLVSYKKSDRAVLALWNGANGAEKERRTIVIPSEKVTAVSMTGSVISEKDGRLALDISAFPIYLQMPTSDCGRVADCINRELVRIQAFSINIARTKPQSISVEIVPSPVLKENIKERLIFSADGEKVETALEIVPEKTMRLIIEFKHILPLSPLEIKVRADITGQEFRRTVPSLLVCSQSDFDDFMNYEFTDMDRTIILDKRSDVAPPDPGIGWKGPNDLSARLLCSWNKENLFIFADVTDDIHCQPFNDLKIYQGDSLQIGIDLGNDGKACGYDTENDYEFGFALSGTDVISWCWASPEGKPKGKVLIPSDIVRQGDQTKYRVAIPWKVLGKIPKNGDIFGISININDNDGSGVRCYLQTSPGLHGIKRPDRFSKLLLTDV